MLAARRSLGVVVSAPVSRRGDGQSSKEAGREDDVGRRSAVRPGRRTPRPTQRDRCSLDKIDGARSRNDVLAARRSLGVVVSAPVSRRGDGQSSKGAGREDDVGRRSAVRPGRRTPRPTQRDRCSLDEVDGARSRNDVLAARRSLDVVVSTPVSRRGDGQSSKEAGREDGVGRRSAVRPGRRTPRPTQRDRCSLDKVDGARSRSDVLAARRSLGVVVSALVSRRGNEQSSKEAGREDGAEMGRAARKLVVRMTSVGAQRCARDGARRVRRNAIGARSTGSTARDQGTTCSRLGARSTSSCRLQ